MRSRCVEIEGSRFLHQSIDSHSPGLRDERPRRGGDSLFVRREFVEVVVIGDALQGRLRLIDAEPTFLRCRSGIADEIGQPWRLHDFASRRVQAAVYRPGRDCARRHQAGAKKSADWSTPIPE